LNFCPNLPPVNKRINILIGLAAGVLLAICLLLWNVPFYKEAVQPGLAEDQNPNPRDERWEKGRLLFRSHCNSCHYIDRSGLGPALAGATQRWHTAGSYQGKTGDEWMKMWVRNWKDVVAAGYPYGVNMAKTRAVEMNQFINLTDRQIDLIFHYVDVTAEASDK